MLALGPTWSVSKFIAELSALAGVRHQLLLISCCDPICSRPSLHVVRGTSSFRCTTQEKALRVYTVYTIPVSARWHRASTSLAGSWFWAFNRSHQSLLARFQLPTGRCFGIVLRWFCQRLGWFGLTSHAVWRKIAQLGLCRTITFPIAKSIYSQLPWHSMERSVNVAETQLRAKLPQGYRIRNWTGFLLQATTAGSHKRKNSKRTCCPMGVALPSLATLAETHDSGGSTPPRSALFFCRISAVSWGRRYPGLVSASHFEVCRRIRCSRKEQVSICINNFLIPQRFENPNIFWHHLQKCGGLLSRSSWPVERHLAAVLEVIDSLDREWLRK